MKNLSLILGLTVLSSLAFASPREFRVNGHTAEAGYAVAWGVPGELVDFEKIEEDEQAVDDFITTKQLHNYVVDLETNKVLKDLSFGDEFVFGRLGNYNLGNHFNIALKRISVDNLPYDSEALVVINNYKWSNALSTLLVVDRSGSTPVVKAEDDKVHDKISAAIYAKLTKTQKETLESRVKDISIEDVFVSKIGYMVKVSISASIPKSEEAGYSVEAMTRIKFSKEKGVEVTATTVKFKKEK